MTDLNNPEIADNPDDEEPDFGDGGEALEDDEEGDE